MYCSSASATAHNHAVIKQDSDRETLEAIFLDYPGQRIHVAALIVLALRSVNRGPEFGTSEEDILFSSAHFRHVIMRGGREGWIHYVAGRGCMLTRDYQAMPSGKPINDHTCPTCKETRVSKAERSCWRCGNPL